MVFSQAPAENLKKKKIKIVETLTFNTNKKVLLSIGTILSLSLSGFF